MPRFFPTWRSLRCKNLGFAHFKLSQKSGWEPSRTQLPLKRVAERASAFFETARGGGAVLPLSCRVAPWVGRSLSVYFRYFRGRLVISLCLLGSLLSLPPRRWSRDSVFKATGEVRIRSGRNCPSLGNNLIPGLWRGRDLKAPFSSTSRVGFVTMIPRHPPLPAYHVRSLCGSWKPLAVVTGTWKIRHCGTVCVYIYLSIYIYISWCQDPLMSLEGISRCLEFPRW